MHLNRKQTKYEDIIGIFKKAGFKIKIKANLHIIDFLGVTFNLIDGMYKPYKKPSDQLLYVNASSNHPPQIIKQVPTTGSDRYQIILQTSRFLIYQKVNIKSSKRKWLQKYYFDSYR